MRRLSGSDDLGLDRFAKRRRTTYFRLPDLRANEPTDSPIAFQERPRQTRRLLSSVPAEACDAWRANAPKPRSRKLWGNRIPAGHLFSKCFISGHSDWSRFSILLPGQYGLIRDTDGFPRNALQTAFARDPSKWSRSGCAKNRQGPHRELIANRLPDCQARFILRIGRPTKQPWW